MIWHLITINFIVGGIAVPSSSETSLYFDIVHKDKIVGSLKATQNNQDAKTYYHSSTTIKTRIIKNIMVNYKYDVTFAGRFLQSADVDIMVNQKPHAKTHTQWKNTEYYITKNGKSQEVLKDTIDYATIQLFFKEPVGIESCYSEQDGSWNTIVPLGNNRYKKINSKGKENSYYYNNGVLEKAIIDGGLIQLQMIAK